MCCFFQTSSFLMFFPIDYFNYKGRWFPFSYHIWAVIPDFSISSRTTAFQCSSCLTFRERHLSALYTWPQLQGIEYMQFLVMTDNTHTLHTHTHTAATYLVLYQWAEADGKWSHTRIFFFCPSMNIKSISSLNPLVKLANVVFKKNENLLKWWLYS